MKSYNFPQPDGPKAVNIIVAEHLGITPEKASRLVELGPGRPVGLAGASLDGKIVQCGAPNVMLVGL